MRKIKTSKVNAIDLAIFLILVFLVISAYISTNSKKLEMLNVKLQDATIVLNVAPEFSSIAEKTRAGDKIYLSESDICVGQISSVKKVFSKSLTVGDDGVPYYLEDSDVYGYQITLKTSVKKNSKGIYIEGALHVAPGKGLLVCIEGDDINMVSTVDSISLK